MNKDHSGKRAFRWLAATAFLMLASAPAFAAADCNNPQGTGEVRACAAAAQGPTALRRFVARTAPIYQLAYADFASRADEVAKADESIKLAARN